MVRRASSTVKKGSMARDELSSSGFGAILSKWRRELDLGAKRWLGYFKRSFVDRLAHIRRVRKNVIVWLVIMLCLIVGTAAESSLYRSATIAASPAAGGSYVVGTDDKLTTISPLAASTDAEKTMSLLAYPSLLRYDETGHLNGYLASAWHASNDGKTWTIQLKETPTWSDGKSVTANDVVFTVDLLSKANNSALSGLKVKAKGARTVQFELPTQLASFDRALTFGILPEHIYKGKSASEITASINNGAGAVSDGPYRLAQANTASKSWRFERNEKYWSTLPNLDEITFREYDSDGDLANAFKSGAVNEIIGLGLNQVKALRNAGARIAENQAADGSFVIFNTDSEAMSDARVRRAVRLMLDRETLRHNIARTAGVKSLTPLETPIARGIYTEVDSIEQPKINKSEAEELLRQAGWKKSNGKWNSTKNRAAISIVAASDSDDALVAKEVASQLESAGLNLKLTLVSGDNLRQQYIQTRNYDMIIYSYYLGGDADVSAYWSSSQASDGLNLAGYSNRRADIALIAGRVNMENSVRASRYASFVGDWMNDCPAIALYQEKAYRAVKSGVQTVQNGDVFVESTSDIARLSDWSASTEPVMRTP